MDVVTEEADLAAAAADEARRRLEEAEAEEEAAADCPVAEARACSGCGLALLEQKQHPPGLVCGGGCEQMFTAGQSLVLKVPPCGATARHISLLKQ